MALDNAHEEEIQRDMLRYKEIAKNKKLLNDIPRSRVSSKASHRSNKATRASAESLPLRKPPYRGDKSTQKPIELTKTAIRKVETKNHKSKSASKVKKMSDLHGVVWGVHTRAVSFADKLSVDSTYDRMVESIRNHTDEIDFGLSHKFVPINMSYETARFSVVSHTAPLGQGVSSFSDDIDSFLRQLDSDPMSSVPLI